MNAFMGDDRNCKRWQIAPSAPQALIERLSMVHPLAAQILYNRGIVEVDDVHAFLEGSYEADNPFRMKGVNRGVALIRQMVKQGETIVIYGDYDVDGVTAAAILAQVIHAMGAEVVTYIPSREDEGYGLNPDAITELAGQGVRLMITVDCGIRSLEEVALARRLGMHVILTDHHHIGAALPHADAVINPRQADCPYPFKDLAGVGVAYKLAQALVRANLRAPLPTTRDELQETDLLDLVALGTVADMVPLLGENHALVIEGLKGINTGHRPGLAALMDVSNITPGQVTTETIGYVLAPPLNAAGRISEATIALKLLMAADMTEALPLAQQLNQLNQDRRALTVEAQTQARDLVIAQRRIPPLLFAATPDFTPGVVGLAASRLVDEFYRPAAVVAIEGDLSKGSARSIPEFHITEALDTLSDLLVRYGGHAAAAGFTVTTDRLPEFKRRLIEMAAEQLQDVPLSPLLHVDAEAPLDMLSWDLYLELARLEPFGFGNPTPVLVSRNARVVRARAVGDDGRHLKFCVRDRKGHIWDAIAFRQGAWIDHLPRRIDIAYVLQRNEWHGRVNLQLNVKDIHEPGSRE
ncbi:MAG: single-stranded-DNA-specific exonuclease RecJ [Anaerolineales bacterium]